MVDLSLPLSLPEKNLFVFAKKEEAFKVLKTHSDARVKGFASRDEAAHFAQHGQDLVLPNATNTNTTANQSFNDSPSGKIQPQQPQLQQQQQMKCEYKANKGRTDGWMGVQLRSCYVVVACCVDEEEAKIGTIRHASLVLCFLSFCFLSILISFCFT